MRNARNSPKQATTQAQGSRGFSIPCTIGNTDFDKGLRDLGASVNLVPYFIFKKRGTHELTPTIITLRLPDRSIKYPWGIAEGVLVKVGKFIIPVDFIVPNMEEDKNMRLIPGRSFLAKSRALIDVQKGHEKRTCKGYKFYRHGTRIGFKIAEGIAFEWIFSNERVRSPVEALSNIKKPSENKGQHPNRMKKRRNQATIMPKCPRNSREKEKVQGC
ncbi:UNVERIFIED_CONTAM: hypothetical protein Sangu_0842300 [Sesamum angustifolium]|uniref:Ribosomal protein L5 n=1 Tax=Sesamum angustifolium TaxID=2727405 RepID=A0AAW2PWZ7_9LAMI